MKLPEITLPQGFVLPDGAVEKGDEFNAVVKFKLLSEGKVQMVAIDGAPLEGRENDEDDTGFQESIMAAYQ